MKFNLQDRVKLIVSGLILLVLSCSAAEAALMSCELCGMEITGQYFIFKRDHEETAICQNCSERWAHCSLCNIPVYGMRPGNQETLCEMCRQEARYCCICDRLITGSFCYTADGSHFYCQSCKDTTPKCSGCKDLLRPGEWRTIGGYKLCERCAAEIPQCAACGVPIFKTSISFKGFSGMFCTQCSSRLPKCVSCGRPCGEGSMELDRHRHVCRDCARTAITTEESLIELAGLVRNHLDKQLLMPIRHRIKVKIVAELGRGLDGSSKESGRFTQSGEEYSISIIQGLRHELCVETLAHEFAHAWQAENIPSLRSDMKREGFAQWVAAKVLQDLKLEHLIGRISDRDDLYGRGYRDICDMEARLGIEGMFKALRKQ